MKAFRNMQRSQRLCSILLRIEALKEDLCGIALGSVRYHFPCTNHSDLDLYKLIHELHSVCIPFRRETFKKKKKKRRALFPVRCGMTQPEGIERLTKSRLILF